MTHLESDKPLRLYSSTSAAVMVLANAAEAPQGEPGSVLMSAQKQGSRTSLIVRRSPKATAKQLTPMPPPEGATGTAQLQPAQWATTSPSPKASIDDTDANKAGSTDTDAKKQGSTDSDAKKQGSTDTDAKKQGSTDTDAKKQGSTDTDAKKPSSELV